MSTTASSILIIGIGYCALVVLLYFAQRSIMYSPEKVRTPPEQAGLPEAEEIVLQTDDGERIFAWHVPPDVESPLILYFHGNSGAVRHAVPLFRELIDEGLGVLAISYRGFGGSTGKPSEAGLIADALAAYSFAEQRYSSKQIVVWGESLGSGVAVALGAERPIAGLILESAFTSAVDVGAALYPLFPVRLLLKDRFESVRRIAQVAAPVLFIHGSLDRLVPINCVHKLYELTRAPKKFVSLPGAGHDDHSGFGVLDGVRAFLTEMVRPSQ